MVHATYAVGKWLRDEKRIERVDFSVFDCIYLMAGPDEWDAKDFDGSEADAMRRLVSGHSYPSGDSGLAMVPMFIKRCHAAGTKVMLSLPGNEQFSFASDAGKRKMFAKVMAAFVKKYDFDGIEIDWEHSLKYEQHAELMCELRAALTELETVDQRKMLTTALHTYADAPLHIAQSWCQTLDWINLMCYDLGGGIWNQMAGHNTPLPFIQKEVERCFEKKDIPREKLCIGLANYGFFYRNLKPGEQITEKLSIDDRGRYFGHTELTGLLADGWTERYDESARVPYYFSPDGKDFVTLDNERSLSEKVDWVKHGGYRGVFWWELHYDLVPTGENERFDRHPLIDHVAKLLGRVELPSKAPSASVHDTN